MIDTVYVVQEGWGLITTETIPNGIGTFGCEQSIGIVLKNKNLIGCVHISNEDFTKNLCIMLSKMMNLNINDDITLLYLIGDNDDLKISILNILFDKQYESLKIVIEKDNPCVSSILVNFETSEIFEYIPTGNEKINHLKTEDKELICCYDPEHPNNNYVIDYYSRYLKTSYYESRISEYLPTDHIAINYDF